MAPSKRKKPKVVITQEDRQRIEAAFYRKAEEYLKMDLSVLLDMDKSGYTGDGFKITGIAAKALSEVIKQKEILITREKLKREGEMV